MSSSTNPSDTPSAEYAEHLSNLVAIPSLSYENYYFLGPVDNPDSTEFIIGETNRIPFRLTNPDLGHWKNTFKSWPSLEKVPPEKSWTTWFKRVSASKRVHWDEIGIGQELDLTIVNSAKDEPLMATASYFWSNTINAFLFNQGPMTPTLIDITMITGLDTTESSPPHQSNNVRDIEYAPGLIPNGGGPSPPIIGYNAPKTSALLQGLIREPADAAKKRNNKSSTVNISAPAKTAKTKKTTPADDLPALDPSSEQALDEEIIEDDVDEAAAEKKKTVVKKKPAAMIPKSAPPVLADLFSFDIRDYLDEAEEDTSSKALAPLSDDLVHVEKSKLDQLSEGIIKSNIDRLEARKIDLMAQLQECNAELDMEHKKLADLPQAVEEQKAKLKSAIKNVADMTKSLKVIPGTDAQDAQAIEEVEQIRQKAISAIQQYLSQ
uniref:Aminotransferase-like protein n=2 Tax=Oryza sativa subsp. japonica TaxID=39947 RepID=Q53KY5_ORYSJ|nr:hypothetical protein LOC_Os11g25660 [Oryza sativa Japonica Group]ABA93375.1 hypothetical protein LOC_Os11g25660 [Oryza sativa Japonica Group]